MIKSSTILKYKHVDVCPQKAQKAARGILHLVRNWKQNRVPTLYTVN